MMLNVVDGLEADAPDSRLSGVPVQGVSAGIDGRQNRAIAVNCDNRISYRLTGATRRYFSEA
jgi:hypothetical protein